MAGTDLLVDIPGVPPWLQAAITGIGVLALGIGWRLRYRFGEPGKPAPAGRTVETTAALAGIATQLVDTEVARSLTAAIERLAGAIERANAMAEGEEEREEKERERDEIRDMIVSLLEQSGIKPPPGRPRGQRPPRLPGS